MKKLLISILGTLAFFAGSIPAFAHIIVHPSQVGIAATEDFTVNVPNEKDNPVVAVKLLLPKGLDSIIPNATAGWTIIAKASEIDWTNGSIPVGQQEEFVFQAQVPDKATMLTWKAYQTYSDGTVVSWDVNPEQMKNLSDSKQDMLADKENKGEYSTTQIVNDLKPTTNTNNASQGSSNFTNVLAWGAFIISIAAFFVAVRKKE